MLDILFSRGMGVYGVRRRLGEQSQDVPSSNFAAPSVSKANL